VQRARHDASRQIPDAEWRRHVRTAIVGHDDAVVDPGDQQVQIRRVTRRIVPGARSDRGDLDVRRRPVPGARQLARHSGDLRARRRGIGPRAISAALASARSSGVIEYMTASIGRSSRSTSQLRARPSKRKPAFSATA
jgi:hypothetical protein